MLSEEIKVSREIVRAGKRLSELGLIAASDGNLSVQLREGKILATPTGVSKGTLGLRDLVRVGRDGKVEGKGKPSSEIRMHLDIYQLRPDVRAVVHAHPPFATAFAVAGIGLSESILPETVLTLGPVSLVPYGTPGTSEVPQRMLPHLLSKKGRDYRNHAFLLANHGAVTLGGTLEEALFRMERLEFLAQVTHFAKRLGKVRSLTKGQELILLRTFGRVR
jgi:L-fuculose-phosphate aldolase